MIARKKPIEIEVMQYNGLNHSECKAFVGKALQIESIDDDGAEYVLLNLRLTTMEGVMMVKPFSWIAKGVKNEFLAIDNEIFELTYDLL